MKKITTLLLAAAVMLMQLTVLPLRMTADAGRSVIASDLIEKGSVACTAEPGKLHITVKTHGLRKLDRVGFTDLSVFQSDDGRAWLLESKCDTTIKLNARVFTDDSITADVEGGHYYRVTCTHYAKGYSAKADAAGYQEAVSVSRSVWVPEATEAQVTVTSAPPAQTSQPAQSASVTASQTTAAARPSGTSAATAISPENSPQKSTLAAAVTTTAAQSGTVSAQPAGTSPATGDKPPVVPAAAMAVSAAVLTLPVMKRRTRR